MSPLVTMQKNAKKTIGFLQYRKYVLQKAPFIISP